MCSKHIQLDDVRVAKQFQILNLPSNLANHIQVLNFLPVEDLDSYLVACKLMLSNCDRGNNEYK